jgi:SsrA-binding protein
MPGKAKEDSRTLATHRRAAHDYHLEQRIESGIVLTGTEVKSARAGKVNLREGYAQVRQGEVFLHNVHISPYEQGNRENHDPLRTRKLLLHAREIRKLARETHSAGVTLVPLRLYLKSGRIKLELAVGRGKKHYDKRESTRRQEAQREIDRAAGSRTVR